MIDDKYKKDVPQSDKLYLFCVMGPKTKGKDDKEIFFDIDPDFE